MYIVSHFSAIRAFASYKYWLLSQFVVLQSSSNGREVNFFCSMQLAVDVQIPDEFGGLNGEAIYIGIAILPCLIYFHFFIRSFRSFVRSLSQATGKSVSLFLFYSTFMQYLSLNS